MISSWDDLDEAEREKLYAWPPQRWVRLNMVVGSDNDAVGADGTSHSLTSAQDRWIVRTVRQCADVVIVGAASVRAEGWFLPPTGSLVVVSRRHNLPDGCPDASRVRVARLDNLSEAVSGATRVLCEGGPSVAGALMSQGLFDELLLSFPLAGNHAKALPAWLNAQPDHWQCVSDIAGDTHRFTIWRRGND